MNKLTIFAISAAVTATVLAVPLASQEIVVSPRSDATFVADVSQDLNEQLRHVRFFDPRADATGIAKVRFQAGEDGRATNVELYQGSGRSQVDRVAEQAVRRLSSLSPMPFGSEEGQIIQANIIVASSQPQLDRLTRRLAREETARIASSPRERAVLALTLAPRPVS